MAKVLVVEDDARVAALLQDVLRHQGHEPLHAADGAKGLEVARAEMPQLVLLDIMLPEVSGFEVCRALKAEARTKGIKIILVSALDKLGDVDKGFAAGADDYVVKPLNIQMLMKKVATHLGA